jgi:phage tail sheath gpL-like
MTTLVITIKSEDSQSLLQQLFEQDTNRNKEVALELSKLFRELASGVKAANVNVSTSTDSPVRASATATLVSVPADDSITINGVTFTAKASPSGEEQFSQAGSNDDDAAALAAKINAHSTLSKQVYATSSSNVVTITAHAYGSAANSIALSESGTSITLSAATLENGAGGSEEQGSTYNLGIS